MPEVPIICAVCGRQEMRPTLRDLYGETGPFEAGQLDQPYVDHAGTGWKWWADFYLCPEHTSLPARWKAHMAAWRADLDAHLVEAETEFRQQRPEPEIRDLCPFSPKEAT